MDELRTMISVKNVSKSFVLPNEQSSGIKQLLVNRLKGKKGYEIQHALKDISFDIKEGEFFGIVGRNGSGKSTLLKLLAGIYVPDSGNIQVGGSLTPFIELGVGFNPELTGRENVFLNGALLGFSTKEMQSMYDDIVTFAELEKFMDQKLKNYSSGMQVRLAFSIAIRAESDILILDEVLAVGDAAFQQKSFNFFEKIKASNKTVILVTHDMSAVSRFCSRAVLIENGSLKLIGSPDEIANQYTVDNINTAEAPLGEENEHTESKEAALSSLELINKSESSLKNDETLSVEVSYILNQSVDSYVGLSISRQGVSIAEVNSIKQELFSKEIGKKQQAELDIDLNSFNPGIYSVSIAAFSSENRALLGAQHNAFDFVIKGIDETRGGALNIKNEWHK